MFERRRGEWGGGRGGEGNELEIESVNGLVSSVIRYHITHRHTPPVTIKGLVMRPN